MSVLIKVMENEAIQDEISRILDCMGIQEGEYIGQGADGKVKDMSCGEIISRSALVVSVASM